MPVGDLKGEQCIVIPVLAGGAVAKGDVVHLEADGYWDKTASGDTGKFGVALNAATAQGDPIQVCIWGPCVVASSAAAIAKGAYVIADAGVVKDAGAIGETTVMGTIVGTAMEAVGSSGGNLTVWIGLVG
jgi:hypothetical protein